MAMAAHVHNLQRESFRSVQLELFILEGGFNKTDVLMMCLLASWQYPTIEVSALPRYDM